MARTCNLKAKEIETGWCRPASVAELSNSGLSERCSLEKKRKRKKEKGRKERKKIHTSIVNLRFAFSFSRKDFHPKPSPPFFSTSHPLSLQVHLNTNCHHFNQSAFEAQVSSQWEVIRVVQGSL